MLGDRYTIKGSAEIEQGAAMTELRAQKIGVEAINNRRASVDASKAYRAKSFDGKAFAFRQAW